MKRVFFKLYLSQEASEEIVKTIIANLLLSNGIREVYQNDWSLLAVFFCNEEMDEKVMAELYVNFMENWRFVVAVEIFYNEEAQEIMKGANLQDKGVGVLKEMYERKVKTENNG